MISSCPGSKIAFKYMNLKDIEVVKKTKVHLSKSHHCAWAVISTQLMQTMWYL